MKYLKNILASTKQWWARLIFYTRRTTKVMLFVLVPLLALAALWYWWTPFLTWLDTVLVYLARFPGDSGSSATLMSRGDTLRNLALSFAGLIGIFIGLPLAIWRSVVAQRQAVAAQQQADTAQRSLLHDRYQRGADMLSSSEIAARIGGVYALEQLAAERPDDYHIQIMDLLCAFIRDEKKSSTSQPNQPCTQDVEVAATVIGRRKQKQMELEKKNQKWALNLTSANLHSAKLPDADLSGASMENVNFSGAHLGNASLSRAYLPRANLSGAHLGNASLSRAYLPRANLSRARLFIANLSGARLSSVDLSRARLFSANLSGVHLASADLSGARLENVNLSGANLTNANLSNARFESVEFSGAKFASGLSSMRDVEVVNLSGSILVKPVGLTQTSLDLAAAEKGKEPELKEAYCAETGGPLAWRGKTI